MGWSLVGAFLGFLLGVFLSVQGVGGVLVLIACTLFGWATAYFVPLMILHGAGRAGSVLYNPSGRSTPRKREYSLAESYVARGRYLDAVAHFEHAILEAPEDPVPYLRIARLKRDELDDLAGAERWFKRALSDAAIPHGTAVLTRKELVELYEVRMGAPRRALPLLARIAAEAEGTPEGAWAAEELTRIKAETVQGPDGP